MATTLATPTQTKSVFRAGARDMSGLAIGYVPFALAIGATISTSGINRLGGWLGGPTIAAGSAHLTLVELIAGGSTALAAASVAIMINARITAYSAGLAPWFRHESRAMKAVLAFFIIDPTYLLATQRFEADDPGASGRRQYFFGMASVLYPLWIVAIAAGIVVGNVIPAGLELTMAAPLMMVGMLALTADAGQNRVAAAAGIVLGALHLGIPAPAVTLIAATLGFGYAYAVTGRPSEEVAR